MKLHSFNHISCEFQYPRSGIVGRDLAMMLKDILKKSGVSPTVEIMRSRLKSLQITDIEFA